MTVSMAARRYDDKVCERGRWDAPGCSRSSDSCGPKNSLGLHTLVNIFRCDVEWTTTEVTESKKQQAKKLIRCYRR